MSKEPLVKFKKINEIVKKHYNQSKDVWERDEYNEIRFKEYFTHRGYKPFESLVSWGTKMTMNEEFFRSDTFDTDEDAIMFIGCSLTMGIGIHDEQKVWPWRVGKHFDMKVWNLGYGGMGEGYISWIATEWLQKLNPKAVCMLIPPPGRHWFWKPIELSWEEWWKDPYWYKDKDCFTKKGMWSGVIHSQLNLMSQSIKDIMLINSMCEEKGIPFILESFDRWIDYEKHGWSDENHPGPLYHEWVSEYFINELTRELEK